MKKPIVVSIIMALMLLTGSFFAPAHAQDPANEEKPTFYRLTPGVYVNSYPRFTVRYPKDWMERPVNLMQGGIFSVSPPGPGPLVRLAQFTIRVNTYPPPLDKFADLIMRTSKSVSTDVTMISDKACQLRDGSQAREVETTMVLGGQRRWELALGIKKGDWWTMMTVSSPNGRIGEDLKAIPYSIEYEPGKDEPVKVPPDVQEFFDSSSNAWISHDLAKVMTHYSDRYLNSGVRKGEMERMFRQTIDLITSSGVTITEFVSAGDKAYLAGFGTSNLWKVVLQETLIIKENGEWKWYGNQRDVFLP